MKAITAILIGAGNRGKDVYGYYTLKNSEKIKIVAVADNNKEKLKSASIMLNLKNNLFENWKDLIKKEKLADIAIIATLDKFHKEQAVAFMKKGYDILLEKPIATNIEDLIEVYNCSKKYNKKIIPCYVLRYSSFYQKIKELLKSKLIGKIITVSQNEYIGYYHMAHSYVRGRWNNTNDSGPIILTKSCHDLDILMWLLDEKCQSLFSSGGLNFFNLKNVPENAGEKCINCKIEKDCPYSAKKIYLDMNNTGWPVTTITEDISYNGRLQAITNSDFGKCVFRCNNNVPDYQIVNMNFTNDIKVNFSLNAFTNEKTRKIHIYGSLGEIIGDFDSGNIEIKIFGKTPKKIKVIPPYNTAHSGSDFQLMDYLVKVINKSNVDNSDNVDNSYYIKNAIESHFLAFAAEESRKNNKIIDIKKFKNTYLNS